MFFCTVTEIPFASSARKGIVYNGFKAMFLECKVLSDLNILGV